MIQRTYILLFLFLGLATMQAQSVEEFIAQSKAYDPKLKAIELEYKAALEKADQVDDWPDPTVNLALGVLPIETRLGPQRFRVGVTQMIPWKGTLNAQRELANAQAGVLEPADEIETINLEYLIRQTYFQLQFLEAQKNLFKERIAIVDGLSELAKSALSSGKGTLSNVLMVERRKTALERDLELISIQMEQYQIKLNQWSGRALTSTIVLDDIEKSEVALGITEKMIQKHPQFQMLSNATKVSQARVALTDYQAKPQIGVGLDYAYVSRRSDVDIAGNGRDILMPMGSIRIPIFKDRYRAIRQEELIRQEAIENRVEAFQDQFETEVAMAYSKIRYAEANIDKYQELKKVTEETISLMRQEFASDKRTFDDLLKVEMELIDYELAILKSYYERNLAIATLLKYQI